MQSFAVDAQNPEEPNMEITALVGAWEKGARTSRRMSRSSSSFAYPGAAQLLGRPEINPVVDGAIRPARRVRPDKCWAIRTFQSLSGFGVDGRIDPGGAPAAPAAVVEGTVSVPPPGDTWLSLPARHGRLGLRPRAFGSNRNGGKARHAGCDLYAPVGRTIYAVRDGVVLRDLRLLRRNRRPGDRPRRLRAALRRDQAQLRPAQGRHREDRASRLPGGPADWHQRAQRHAASEDVHRAMPAATSAEIRRHLPQSAAMAYPSCAAPISSTRHLLTDWKRGSPHPVSLTPPACAGVHRQVLPPAALILPPQPGDAGPLTLQRAACQSMGGISTPTASPTACGCCRRAWCRLRWPIGVRSLVGLSAAL